MVEWCGRVVFWWKMGFLQRLEFYGGDDSIETLTKFEGFKQRRNLGRGRKSIDFW